MNSKLPLHRNQSGIVLFVALIVLVIMSLVGLSMIRQISSGQVVAGNLAFKEGSVAISDLAVETARSVIRATGTGSIDLTKDYAQQSSNAEALGYFASAPWEFGEAAAVPFDMFNAANWANSKLVAAASSATQENEVRYVIHRLCRREGPLDTNQCSLKLTTVGGSKGGSSYTDPALPQTQQPYYRVTTRVLGPRNTVSYTQVILY